MHCKDRGVIPGALQNILEGNFVLLLIITSKTCRYLFNHFLASNHEKILLKSCQRLLQYTTLTDTEINLLALSRHPDGRLATGNVKLYRIYS